MQSDCALQYVVGTWHMAACYTVVPSSTMYLVQGRRSCSRRDLSRKYCLCSQTNKESVSACPALQCNVAHPAFSSPDAWQKTSNNENFDEKCVVQTTRSVYEKTIFSKNRKILQEGFLNENNGASRPIHHTLVCSMWQSIWV